MFYASWLGVDNGPLPDEISSTCSSFPKLLAFHLKKFPSKCPCFQFLVVKVLIAFHLSYLLYSDINPGLLRADSMDSVSDAHKYSSINLRGKNIHCSQKKPSIALAEWGNHLFGIPPSEVVEPAHPASNFRAAKIRFFVKFSFNVGQEVSYMIVAVSWFCPHPNQYLLGKPAEVCCHDKLEHPGIRIYQLRRLQVDVCTAQEFSTETL